MYVWMSKSLEQMGGFGRGRLGAQLYKSCGRRPAAAVTGQRHVRLAGRTPRVCSPLASAPPPHRYHMQGTAGYLLWSVAYGQK